MPILADSICAGIQLPDNRPLDYWAEDKILFPGSPISEKFQRENVPMLIKPLRAWDNPAVWAVSVLAGVQGCKTGFEQTVIARAIACRRGNMLVTAQTDEEATFFAKTKLLPSLRKSPATRAAMATLGRDDVTKEHIIFPDMFVQIQGPSLSGLQSKTIWYIINDEMWRWNKGTMAELLRRANAVRNKKVLSVSQGGQQIEGDNGQADWDEWGSWWHQGTQEMFNVRCPSCELFFPPETKHPDTGKYIMVWDTNPDTRNPETKEWNWAAMRQTVRMQCPHCDAPIVNRERDRKRLVQDWEYQQTNDNPSPGHESYRYSGYTLWWRDWADIIEGLLRARDALRYGNIEDLKAFVQKEEARFWTLKDADIPIINIKTASGYRIETYERKPEDADPPKWEHEIRRFMAVDMQRDRFPLAIRAFGNGCSRNLLYCEPQHVEEVKEIEIAYGIPSALVGFDVGNWSAEALRFCFQNKWTPLRGRDIRNFTKARGGRKKPALIPYQAVMERLTGEKIYGQNQTIKVWEWSNLFYKDLLSRLRVMREHEIPDDMSQVYIEGMESEAKDKKTGIWKQIGKRANHPWDVEAMITFMASLYKLVGGPQENEEEETE